MSNSLREALSDATAVLEDILDAFSRGEGGVYKSDVAEVIDNARAALAKPPRNCDVGTVKEQAKRMEDFCNQYETCRLCRLHKSPLQCELEWTQMPYEADKKGETDGSK